VNSTDINSSSDSSTLLIARLKAFSELKEDYRQAENNNIGAKKY